jgi:tetratricopeptide (TPR) repeat protein
MNYRFFRYLLAYIFLVTGFCLVYSVVPPLAKMSMAQDNREKARSIPLVEFRRQKQGTEARFLTEYQNLRNLQAERDNLERGNTAAIEQNKAALAKSYSSIATFFESVNLDSNYILKVFAQPSASSNSWEIMVEFNNEGGEKFAQLTQNLAGTGRSVGIFIRGELVSAPTVGVEFARMGITGGKAVITGNLSLEAAWDLASQLDAEARKLRESTPEGRVYTLIESGKKKFEGKDFSGAITDFTQAIELDSKNIIAYGNRGVVKEQLKDYRGAIADYSEVIRLDPKNIDAYVARAKVKEQIQDYRGAVADYESILENQPERIDVIATPLLNNYLILEAKQEALAFVDRFANFYKLSQNNSFVPYVYTIRAWLFIAFADYSEALKECDRALENNPNFTFAYLYRGLALDELGNTDAATKDYQKILSIEPKDTLPKELETLDNNPTFADYLKTIELRGLAQAYYVRGIARYQLNQPKEAIEDLDKALELNPNYALAYQGRGLIKETLENSQQANEDLQKAEQLIDSPDSLSPIGLGYTRQGIEKFAKILENRSRN